MTALTVLLMRHGHAVDEAPHLGDHGRWLTAKGRERTRLVADKLVEHKVHPTHIWTSPLVRAVQTADIVASVLGFSQEIPAIADLVVDGRPRAVAQMIFAHDEPRDVLLIVGHEPSLSVLANTLLGAHEWAGFKKSGVLALAVDQKKQSAKKLFAIEP
ncbi:MAG: histidine phosphatase family protein [Polyangiales bacterium]